MNPSSGNKGVNHLAQVLAGQSKKDQDRNSALVLDFGEIMDDYSLQTNTFSIPIPVEDYHVCRQLTLGKTGDILAKTQEIGSPGSGEHNHKKVATLLDSRGLPCTGTIGIPRPDNRPARPTAEQRRQRRRRGRPPAPRFDPRENAPPETWGPCSGGLGAVGGRCGGYYLPGGRPEKITRRKEGLSHG